jgi:dihydrofolate reductase
MRRVVVTEYLSLDGVMNEPAWTEPYWYDEISKFKYDELLASAALLFGRVTYQGFAEAWPGRSDEAGFADRMNSLPKFVVSNSLEKLDWSNSHLIKGDIAHDVALLKQQPGQDILVYGGGELVRSLMPKGLVDEYRLLVYPVVVGTGKYLSQGGSRATLKLVETKTFSCGVVAVIYAPADERQKGDAK